MQRGFTLLEMILSIGMLAMLLFVGVQAETTMQNVLAGRGARQIESILDTAAQRARNGINGTNWGVYFAYDETTRFATQAVVFSGNAYATRDTSKDMVFTLGKSLKQTSVILSGSGASSGNDHEIVFVFESGSTTQYGSMTVTNFASTTQMSISSTGIAVRQ